MRDGGRVFIGYTPYVMQSRGIDIHLVEIVCGNCAKLIRCKKHIGEGTDYPATECRDWEVKDD